MKYITEENLKIFAEEERLNDLARKANHAWLKEVKKAENGEIKYEDTRPLFDKYLEAHKKWQKYYYSNTSTLLAEKLD